MAEEDQSQPPNENNDDFNVYIDVLKNLCTNNAAYFQEDTSENGQRLYVSFTSMLDSVDLISSKYDRIRRKAPLFDFDAATPANGYRSFLSVVDSAVSVTIDLGKRIELKRASSLFRKTSVTKDVETCAALLASLDTCLKILETILSWSSDGNLFPSEENSPLEILAQLDTINQYCFYGRNLGFQFSDPFKNILTFISLTMAVFSEIYYGDRSLLSHITNSVVISAKYLNDPEQKARRIVNIFQNANVDFCKSFWSLSEHSIMSQIPLQKVAVSKIIKLTPEPFTVTVNGQEVDVPVPSSHIGIKPVQVRLISYDVHEGMIGEGSNKTKAEPPVRGLLFHCHGGGFVSQSSKSHEFYLREWARLLKVPIVSVDYSLAPEAPFPRALEEVTYAYCWTLKNAHLLGSTGERIVAAGDSAGANLILSMTLKCIHLGLPTPVGLFAAYVPTFVNIMPSPARLLSIMDPLLPFGFMIRCLKAYAFPNNNCASDTNLINDGQQTIINNNASSDTDSFEEISESDLMELQAHKSPISETSDTLTYGSLNSNGAAAEVIVDDGNNLDQTSEKYVSDFLEKYVLDSDTDTDGTTRVPVLKHESCTSSVTSTAATVSDYSLRNRLTSFMAGLKGRIGGFVTTTTDSNAKSVSNCAGKYLDLERKNSFFKEFLVDIPKDPYLSPYCAKDDDLKLFPPTRILSVHLDPCLDDSIMFAKKLRNLGNDVKVDILSGIPHGFLNFSSVSKEAHDGSLRCVERIQELLNLDNLPKPL